MLGRLTIDALPLYSAIAFGGALVTIGGARRRGGHHLVQAMALPLERMADQRRPQAHRHHV
jgi:hypothetical protein